MSAAKPFRLEGASRSQIAAAHTSLVNACLWWCKAHGIKAHKHNSGATATARGGFVRYGFAGCPDILGVLPGGKHMAVECKTGTGRLTPEQDEYRREVEALGAVFVLARDLEALEVALRPFVNVVVKGVAAPAKMPTVRRRRALTCGQRRTAR